MKDRFEKFSYFITETAKHLHKIEQSEMESLGLKGPYAIYLLAIARYKDGITAARLSEECARDKADVSRAVKAMEDKGLLERSSSVKRGYRAPIRLTELGKRAAKQLEAKARAAVEFANVNVPSEDLKIFYKTLEALLKNIRTMSKTGVPDAEN